MRNWVLPEGIEDILPEEAARIETLRGAVLDVFRTHGYQLVVPPLLEYVESLLTGTGRDLDLRTFKLVDQLSGRMMGLRADITPQVARIDAHLLGWRGVTRLCYCGSVLHTRPRGLDATREPIQIGAEIYGHAGIDSDLEIQRLLYASLRACGIGEPRLDIGHVGVFRALCSLGAVAPGLETELHEALEAKDTGRLEALTGDLSDIPRQAMLSLPGLYGDPDVIDRARSVLPADQGVRAALDDLERLARDNHFRVSVDLADLRGYQYHSGVMFAAYMPGVPNAVALGGRYDNVGRAFGRARPATGFSMDLRGLAWALPALEPGRGIRAPSEDEPGLLEVIERLRAAGEVVVRDLPGAVSEGWMLDRELVRSGDGWVVRARN